MGKAVFPVCCLVWGQTIDPQETPGHSHASLPQSPIDFQSQIKIVALLNKFKDPQQISQTGDPAKGLRTPREFDCGGQSDG